MSNLYEALEVCLKDIELGEDIETSLLRYPDIADELRPVLETSVYAKRLAVSVPSEDMMRRNRVKLLQRAAEMRAAKLKAPSTASWLLSFRRAAVALAVLVIAFLSGTSLVRASTTTLPGDNLYPVKRTCEDLALFFTFDSLQRNSLEVEYENERLDELHELIAIGRSAEVDFAGIVTHQNGNQWVVAGVPVMISPQTDLHDGAVFVGDAVRVFGITQGNNSVLAERIDQLPEDANLPEAGNSGKGSESDSNSGSGNVNDSSGPGNGNDNSHENDSGPGGGSDNGNDNNSGPGGGNDNSNDNNSGPGGGGDNNDDNSGSGSGNDDESNSGSGSSQDQSINDGGEDNSGSGGGRDNSNEDNSDSGGGGDDD